MSTPLKLVAFDLDGTLTQHKTPIEPQNRAVLEALSQRYHLLMVGAGNAQRAHQGTRRALAISLAVTAVLMVPVLVFAPQLTAFFNRKAEVVAYGTLLLRYISPFYLLCCINQIYSGALRGAGNSQVPMVIMLGSFVVFRQIYLYIMSHYISNALLPLAMGYPAGWLVCSAATLLYYRRAALGRRRLVEDN